MKRFALALFLTLPALALADEGMWTYNNFPSAKVKQKYSFDATDKWLENVRLSSVRLAGGCSGSIVSDSGLVMTNHHCAHSCIEQLSTAKKDYVASGFLAKTEKDEVKCPEIEINQLVAITDVTERVNAATKGLADQAFNDAQKAETAKIEKECATSDALRCDVVTLYRGGLYNLYKYRRYQDVRLAFAPEFQIAFFGGDPDNFMFPRYDLDVSFLRLYQDGKPAKTENHFKWSANGAQEGELTFVSGHPGSTSRSLTVAQLEYERDWRLPKRLLLSSEMRGYLTEFQNRGPEQKRVSNGMLFYIENSLKAIKGRHQALLDKNFMASKIKAENELRAKVAADPKLASAKGAWDGLAKAIEEFKPFYRHYSFIEDGGGFRSDVYSFAKTLVRATEELPKPNEKRLREYTDSKLPGLKQKLFSSAPVYDEFEIATLTFSLTKLREELGPDDSIVKKLFGKQSPREIATNLIKTSKLKDVKVRKALFEGGKAAVDASTDPMIAFAKLVDPDARILRKRYEDTIEGPTKKNSELIAKAMFQVYGTSTYPDATFTLRLSYGQVKGFTEFGKDVKPFTTFAGAFDRHTGRDPFALPASWLKAQPKLTPETRFNFVSTNDIIGGNSGSPVINKNAEIVGLVFDGNIQSLGGEYGFDESVNRTVSVHSDALIEALEKVYGAQRIANELRPKQASAQ